MRYLALGEVVELHGRLLEATGGASGIRDFGALESAIAQPKATFGGRRSVIHRWLRKRRRWVLALQGHAFVDGNRRVGHAAMETFLTLNGSEIDASVDDQERLILDLAAGRIGRHLVDWLRQHIKPLA